MIVTFILYITRNKLCAGRRSYVYNDNCDDDNIGRYGLLKQ